MENNSQLAVIPYTELRKMAEDVHNSGMLGTTSPEQALVLMGICQAEGLHPMTVQKRYHIIENKASMRADAMTGEFKARGAKIVWHLRTDDVCAATFFEKGTDPTEEAIERGRKRCRALIKKDLETLIDLSMPGEETILWTFADAQKKGITEGKYGTKKNWAQSPRAMLTARVETEGIRLVDPGLVAGIYSEDEVNQIAENERAEQPTAEQRIIDHEAKRLEANGIDPAKAKPFKPKAEPAPEPEPQTTEKPVEGKVIEMPTEAVAESEPLPTETVDTHARKPITAMDASELPEGEQWRAYVISQLNHPDYVGKRLDALSVELLTQAKAGWVDKFAEKIANNPAKQKEADLILHALGVRKDQAAGNYPTDQEIEAEIHANQ